MSRNPQLTVRVREDYQSLVPPLSEEDYRKLADSIKHHGLLHPIIVTPDDVVLDGHHRLRLCQELGIEPRIEVRNVSDPEAFILETNIARRQLNDYQKVELAQKLLEKARESVEVKEHARKAQLASKIGLVPNGTFAQGGAIQVVAPTVGVSVRTFQRAQAVVEKAPQTLKELVRAGEVSINQAYKEVRKAESKLPQQAATPSTLKVPFSRNRFWKLIRALQRLPRRGLTEALAVAGELYHMENQAVRTSMWNRLRIMSDEETFASPLAQVTVEALYTRYLDWKDNPKRDGDAERMFMAAVRVLIEEPKDRRGDMILHILRGVDEGIPEARDIVEAWHKRVETLPEWATCAHDGEKMIEVSKCANELPESSELRPLWEEFRRTQARKQGKTPKSAKGLDLFSQKN